MTDCMKKKWHGYLCLLISTTLRKTKPVKAALFFWSLLMAASVQASDNNLQISGALVTEPCNLDVNNNTLAVDFGTVIEKGLYKDIRTLGVPLHITLTDCDISLGKTVSITLSGSESSSLPGYMTTTGTGSTGIDIGFELPDGKKLPVNQPSPEFNLQDGIVQITLMAYVRAESDAIKNKSLVPGDFKATATIDAAYP